MAVYKDEKTGKWYCKFYYHDHTGKQQVQSQQWDHPAQQDHPRLDGHRKEQVIVLGIIKLALRGEYTADHRQAKAHQASHGKIEPVQSHFMVRLGKLAEGQAHHTAQDDADIHIQHSK